MQRTRLDEVRAEAIVMSRPMTQCATRIRYQRQRRFVDASCCWRGAQSTGAFLSSVSSSLIQFTIAAAARVPLSLVRSGKARSPQMHKAPSTRHHVAAVLFGHILQQPTECSNKKHRQGPGGSTGSAGETGSIVITWSVPEEPGASVRFRRSRLAGTERALGALGVASSSPSLLQRSTSPRSPPERLASPCLCPLTLCRPPTRPPPLSARSAPKRASKASPASVDTLG